MPMPYGYGLPYGLPGGNAPEAIGQQDINPRNPDWWNQFVGDRSYPSTDPNVIQPPPTGDYPMEEDIPGGGDPRILALQELMRRRG